MNLYVGTSGYSYPKWKGRFYPKDIASQQMLRYYASQFRAVEINSSFYRMPEPATLKGWAADVPEEFKFTLKAPQQITHRLRLKNAEDPVRRFVDVAGALGQRLGPLLFQMPPNMKKDAACLRDSLALLPSQLRAAFEFRHSSWFDDEVLDLLRDHSVALCIAEEDNDLQVPFVATAKWGYLRLRRAEYRDSELKERIKRMRSQKWTDAFVFFKHEDEAKGPRFAKQFLTLAERI
jgi:uncharacterized protein YecE (DUF72 family)